MPPKPTQGKKKDDQEDYSDVHTLPPLNSVVTTIVFRSFFSHATREKVQRTVFEKLPLEQKVKVITREDLIAYAKQKQIILEPNVAATLTQDDPRLKMNEAEQLSKAAQDKIFELSVVARRAKKEKIQKLEEEAKLQQQPGTDSIGQVGSQQSDQDQLDLIFNLVDFPQNKAEALSLAKYNLTVNSVVDIQQKLKVAESHDEDADEQEEQLTEQEQESNDPEEDQIKSKMQDKLEQLIQARAVSTKDSPLRFLYVQNLDFVNVPYIGTKVNEQGEEVEDKKDAEAHFFTQLVRKLEHIGALLLKYQRFREKVPLMPLMPDKSTIMRIKELQQQSDEYHRWLQTLDQQQLNVNQSQKSIALTSDPAHDEQMKLDLEEQKNVKAIEEDMRQRKIQELKYNFSVSMDDVKDYSNLKLNTYQKDFINIKEQKNSISAIMSAMVTQISNGEPKFINPMEYQDDEEGSTELETIDDLFDDFAKEISYDLQLEQRPEKQTSNYQQQDGDNSFSQSPHLRKQGTQAFAYQKTVIGEFEFHEESDRSKQPLCKLPKQVKISDEEKAENICLREKLVLDQLVLPGLNRHLMPQVPSKSQRIRDSERPQLYPFSTLPIEDTERALIFKAFQDLLKSNFIDEGQVGDAKHSKYKAFERCFEQHMKPEILRQVLAEALLKEPDVATLYYPRNDSLLVALYNKIKSIQGKEDDYHGEREWKAAYRVMPDFENWVKFFSDELIVPMQAQNIKDINLNIKYQMDEEMIPDQMLDIDDLKIQNISEKSKLFYPADGSIMRVDQFSVGGQQYQKSVVFKDNLTFGLRKSQHQETIPESEKEYDFYSIKKSGPVEFWLNFENDTKLLVEHFTYEKNPQRLIRIDPPKPTPEEIAAREEAIKQAQAAAAKNKGKGSALANMPVIEEFKDPEPTWEPEPLDFLDKNIDQDFIHQGTEVSQTTVTLQNGLIVKFTEHGDIVQMTEEQIFEQSIQEKDRMIISESGVVVRHFRNRDAEVLFPNGQTAHFNKKDMMWIITNNKGRRVAKKAGIEWDIDSIPCATETDAVTNARMMIREDKVMTIQFKDGSVYCQHADGTLMRTSANGKQIRIEKEGFAPVVCHKGLRNIEENYLDNQQNYLKDSKDRVFKGWLMETHLPDGTIVETFYDKLTFSSGVRHFFKRPDFSVVSIDMFGNTSIISSNQRSAMNEQNGRRLMGQDIDYIQGLYLGQESLMKFGVYHALFKSSVNNEIAGLFTIDETNKKIYQITDKIDLQKVDHPYAQQFSYLQPVIQFNSQVNAIHSEDGRELEDIDSYKNSLTKNFIHPRLFVINNDGTGYELLTREQLEYYFRIAKHKQECLKYRKNVMVGTTMAKTHYFVTKAKNMQDFEIENQLLKSLDFPKNAEYALLHNKQKQGNQVEQYLAYEQKRNLPTQYLFRQIFEFQEFEIFKQEAFYDDFNRFKQWKMSQVRYDSEFGIFHVPTKDQVLDYKKIEDDEYYAKRIITKIMKERRNKRTKFDADIFKMEFIRGSGNDEEVIEYYKRGNSIQEKEINQGGADQSYSIAHDKQFQYQQMQEQINMEKIRNIKKKQEINIQNSLSDIRRMINTPTFLPTYFQSKQGQTFTKNNPQKPPSQEMIMRMSQRINRSQNNTEKAHSQYDPTQSQRGDNHSPNNQIEGGEDKESPIVALEPEDHYKQGSNFAGARKLTQTANQTGPQPSLYIQEKLYMKQREQEQILKAEEYHVVKTKDFNVVGRLRQEKPYVKAIQKSQAQSELNEKFITTECIADRRVKISSMAPRQFINAPSIEDVRKQGQHQMILSAINKKQTFAELINQANSMVTSVLHDPLKRSLNIMPSVLKFGVLQAGGGPYELIFTMKNEDSIAQRVTIKPLNDKRIQVQQIETGPIATGITRKVSVFINSAEECTIKETLQIVTKTDIFKIPIEAQLLSPENYQRELQEQRALNGRTLANSRVRNKLNDSIQKGRISAQGARVGGGIVHDNGSDDGGDYNKASQQWIETTNSDSRLPQIPQTNQRAFEVDPKKNLKDLLKR